MIDALLRAHAPYWPVQRYTENRAEYATPAFRGFDRSTVPVTFLTILAQTGLFEAERVKVATGVAWFHRQRRHDATIPVDDAVRDPEFITRLARTYMRYPA